MRDFENLIVWQEAHALALDIYRATRRFPEAERYGLTSQLRRAAVSAPSNIAEGYGRGGDPELHRFLSYALGSVSEVRYQVLLARDLGLFAGTTATQLLEKTDLVRRLLVRLSARCA